MKDYQKSNTKYQNEKDKFKKEFVRRLIRLSIDTIGFCEALKQSRIMWPISDQLIRNSTSIGANIVEAKASSSKREYIKFFEIALKSANETVYWLIVIKESQPKFSKQVNKLLTEAKEISKIIGSSVLTLKGKKSF